MLVSYYFRLILILYHKNLHLYLDQLLLYNYEKLLPSLLDFGIAKKVKLMNSNSYLLNAKSLYKYVKVILKKDIHYFEDLREFSKEELKSIFELTK